MRVIAIKSGRLWLVPTKLKSKVKLAAQSGVTSLWNMIKYYLIYFIVVGHVAHGFWFWRRSSSSPTQKPAKCPEVPNTKEKVEMGIKQCQESVRTKLISEAYGLYKSKFLEEHKSTNFFEDAKPDVANIEFESEHELDKFLEKVKNNSNQNEFNHKPLDIPKDILQNSPLEDSFSKVHDQDHVWGTTPLPKSKWDFTPSENFIQASSKEWTPSSTFAPTLETYESSSQDSISPLKTQLPWNPPPKDYPPSESGHLQHYNYSPTSQSTVSPTKSFDNLLQYNYTSDNFWGNLKKAQHHAILNLNDQKGPIYENFESQVSPISKYEEFGLQKEGYSQQIFGNPLQDSFQEPLRYHNFHPTEYKKLTSSYVFPLEDPSLQAFVKAKNLFEPNYFVQQYTTKAIFTPAHDPKNVFASQNQQQIFQQTQIEYPKELFMPVGKQFPEELFQPAPEKSLFHPASRLPRENFFMSQDQFYPTSKANLVSSPNTNLQPNPAILEILQDAKRNKKHPRIRRSTKKIYHPNLLSAEDKRLAGCLLNCVYEKHNVLDSNGWPTLEGLLLFYSEGINDQNFFMTIFRASDVCLKSFSSKYKPKEKRQSYGDSCDVAFEVFDCIADQITGYCTEK